MQVKISGTMERAIRDAVRSGEFDSPEAYLRAALRHFHIQRLNAELEKGYQDIESGNVIEITDIGSFFERLNREIDDELNAPS